MTDRIIRIKAGRKAYRRAGLALGLDWLELDTTDLSEAQKSALLADSVLSIEGREDDGSWTPLASDIRAGLVEVLRSESVLPPATRLDLAIDPIVVAQWDDLQRGFVEHQAVLEGLDLWPVQDPSAVVDGLVARLVESGATIAELRQDVGRLTAELAAQNTPREDRQGDRGGDAAAPAGGDQSQGVPPATVGQGAQGGGSEPPPEPAPRGRKPAKSTAG